MNPFKLITKPIGWLFNLVGGLLVLAIILLLLGWFAAGYALEPMLTKHLEGEHGITVEASALRLNLVSMGAVAEQLRLRNPEPFPAESLLEIEKLTIEHGWKELPGEDEPVSLAKVELHISRLSMLSNSAGDINLQDLVSALPQWLSNGQEDGLLRYAQRPLSIESLVLRIDSIEEGTAQGGRVEASRFSVDYRREFSDVTHWPEVLSLVATDFRQLGRQRLAQVLDGQSSSETHSVQDILRDVLEKLPQN